jgi:LmbE family N-acetylglucosaminyl deacetylase
MDPTSVLLQRDDFSYINHPDHRAVGEASIYAVFPSAETRPIFPELLAEGLEPHHVWEVYFTVSMQEQIAVDITGTFDRKMKALLEHKSQVGPDVEALMRTWDTRAGAEAGVPMAETFRVMRFGERNIAPGV